MNTDKNIIRLLIGLQILVVSFHTLILLGAIPYEIAWGGRLKSVQEMYISEGVTISLNILLIWTLSLKSKNAKGKLVNTILWAFVVIFSLNTIGNLFAKTIIEKSFSILTLILALMLLKLVWKKKIEKTS